MKNKIQILTLIVSIIFFGCEKDDHGVNLATISSLDCDNAKINGVLSSNTTEIIQGVFVTNLELSLNYSGGNGGEYSGILISSTGVSGLQASASSGNLAIGNGTIKLKINGTPSSNGDAFFEIDLGA